MPAAWKTSCEQVAEQDALLTAKDEEITALQVKVAASRLSEEEDCLFFLICYTRQHHHDRPLTPAAQKLGVVRPPC